MTGRDKNGQFKKGEYKGGPGRPKKEREVEYYRILTMRCTREDWDAIVDKAVKQAKGGDSVARKWLADYLIGPPVERKEISGPDGDVIRVTLKSND